MVIVGIDASINGTGLSFVEFEGCEVVGRRYSFFTRKKKDLELAKNRPVIEPVFIGDLEDKTKTERNMIVVDRMMRVIENNQAEFAAIEDYAMGIRNGVVFDIGEFCGLIKVRLLESGMKFRTYDIPSIKIFASGNGAAKKDQMLLAYKMQGDGELLIQEKDGSPMSDMIDAYYISEMLRLELGLRAGILNLKDLSENHRRIFLRTTKGNPVNILDRGWNE